MTPLLSRFRRFASLPRVEQRLFVFAWAAHPLVWLMLRMLGLTRLRAALLRGEIRYPSVPQPAPERVSRALEAAARYSPFPSSCLSRSLLLEYALHRQGVTAQLRIGVRLEEGRLRAHAWVECDGMPVNDTLAAVRDFEPFPGPIPIRSFHHP